MSTQEKDALIIFGLTKYKALRPPSWRYRAVWRRMIEEHPTHAAALAAHVMRAYGGKVGKGATSDRLGRRRGIGVTVTSGPVKSFTYQMFEHAGAEWLLKHEVKAAVNDDAYNLSTFVPNKAKFALLDARREETQGGLTGRHEGVNRAPKRVGLSRGFDGPEVDTLDSDQYPLVRRSEDPLIGAARTEMQLAILAAHEAFSKPTARARIGKQYAEGWRPDVRGIDEPTGFNPDAEFSRVPKYHLNDWSWKPDGRLPEQMACWPVTADSEFRDFGVVVDCSGWEPRVPVPRAEWLLAHRPGKTETDGREREIPKIRMPLRLDGTALRLRVKAAFDLMDADERTALCAQWE